MIEAPPPPVATARPVAMYDTECYPNYWLLKVQPVGGAVYSFRLYAGQSFDREQRARILLLFDAYCMVSFNGNGYDVPMITAALAGYSCEQLKWLNDRIIVDKCKPWDLGLPDWSPPDHIDIMETAPGAGSQKQYAGRIHYKTMRDLPYEPSTYLDADQVRNVDEYCENDLGQLFALYNALRPQLLMREKLGKRYGIDLRSKSDAQVAEAVLRVRCEKVTGRRLYKPEIDWNLKFHYTPPAFVAFESPALQQILQAARESIFELGASGNVEMPRQLEGLCVTIGATTYKLGIGGLHSQEKKLIAVSDEHYLIRMPDVASYYPNLIINSGAWPIALGPSFVDEYRAIKNERLEVFKPRVKAIEHAGKKHSPEWQDAKADDEGGKTGINGGFGKTGSPFSILFAPQMLIQTTLTGQLSLLMLIEWHERYGIPVVSANTDGLVLKCPRDKLATSEYLIEEWQRRTGLEMETEDYIGIYARDVNNYFAVKTPDDVKRKGEYGKAGLVEKKNPDCEICSDAVADYLAKGVPIEYSIAACRDIRKFVTIQRVSGGGVKLWGEGPRKGALVRDMLGTLQAGGWVKEGRQWRKGDRLANAATAYESCFAPQRPEHLGKVVRWYYGTRSPGPIVYASNGNTVGMSYGAQPCMTLPDEFPDDIDYSWYLAKARQILVDIGQLLL